jgi:hypothetical protein
MPEETQVAEKNEAYLGSWADKASAETGLGNMQSKMTSMGDDLGNLREQVATANQTIADMQTQQVQATNELTSQSEADLAEVQQEMLALDDADPDYHQNLVSLMGRSDSLSRSIQHEKTLTDARTIFKEELNNRDIKATHQAFYKDNPDFNTPEMQTQIQERLAQDPSGMSDSLVAYREIQRDAAMLQAKTFEEENANLKRLANVAEGTQKTGKIVTTGQSPPQVASTTKSNADIDNEMQTALDALRA